MGCDGGTIPKRSEMIKTKKKAMRDKKQDELIARWFYCALSNHELRRPVMGCELGRLYNKEELLTALLDKPNKPESIEHIRGLKDLRELKLTPNKSFNRKALEKAEGYIDYQNSEFMCPVLGVEMNGHYSFVFLWSCGCVFSERALKELKTNNCLVCGQARKENDVINLYPEGNDADLMRSNLLNRRAVGKVSSRKRELEYESHKEEVIPEEAVKVISKVSSVDVDSYEKKPKLEAKRKNHKSHTSKKISKSNSTANSILVKDVASSVSKYGKVSDNPHASEVYKSLFTSSQKEPPALQSPWVTYNPYRL
ncbi:hypothetical protein LOD99_1008 [Oopsacas minuta]|uniref:Replication termination factor 2 n=1 Tax=Oopsacas minuta TaxID=111878 RepID=A0AAV7K0D6_9METZ|nr:hypothetical protein LOD99_1008 [Oopsacas minuta]